MGTLEDVHQLTCLWMLTPPDGTTEGNVPFIEDPQLPELTTFLREQRLAGRRDIRLMREYFGRRRWHYAAYRDDRDDFSRATRASYFRDVPDHLLERAVVFFDPDVGIEPASSPSNEKHLHYAELRDVYRRMGSTSIAVIYQHQRRIPNGWRAMGVELCRQLGADVTWVSEPDVAFYLAPRSEVDRRRLPSILSPIVSRRTPGKRASRSVGAVQRRA
jgi:hypothetical protein